MRRPQKENLFNSLNRTHSPHPHSTLNCKKDSSAQKPVFRDCQAFVQKMLILKQSALLALAEKNELIEDLTHKLSDSQTECIQRCLLQQEENPAMDLLLAKISQKNDQLQNAIQRIEKQEAQLEKYIEQMENMEWQRHQLLGQLQRYEVENQDLREMVQELIAQNQKLREQQQQLYFHLNAIQIRSQSVSPHELSVQKSESKLGWSSQEQIEANLGSNLPQSSSIPINILLQSKNIPQFTHNNEEGGLIYSGQNSVGSADTKEPNNGRHCLGLSLKAINLIDTYSLNSAKKRMPDCDSQMTTRYFHYVLEKDLEGRLENASVDQLQAQSCQDIAEETEQKEADSESQNIVRTDQQMRTEWKWGLLGAAIGAALALLFKK